MDFTLIICPGIHPPALTQSFIQGLQLDRQSTDNLKLLVFPTEEYPAYSAIALDHWLTKQLAEPHNEPPLILIAFSAGVVGAIGAACTWQIRGGKIKALIAIDGWGVPLLANFPLYRLSHDYFTHWSSALLGRGNHSFYCDRAVEHLALWRSPQTAWGWQEIGWGLKIRCSAAEYLQSLLI